MLKCQFARVVKGVDLRSTGRKTAWVRTPQLTSFVLSRADTQRVQVGGRSTQMSFGPSAGQPRQDMTVWPSGLRRWLKAPFRKGVGSNPTAVTSYAREVSLGGGGVGFFDGQMTLKGGGGQMTLAGLEPAIFGSEDRRLIH